ncbi:bifunctional enoyl-CoA hydratase/phosphate acetyltransferase [Sphingomonas molluscorum]|uniref:bifunctional enoyl-CoA hydratase/phosphate acetyltransferase n=2 Tax=Pseudomonadota TaxID=1224 RepID=UPI0031D6DC05
MTDIKVLDARSNLRGGYKVDVSRGERVGRVSSEWFNRPAGGGRRRLTSLPIQPRIDPMPAGERFDTLLERARGRGAIRMAIVHPTTEVVLRAAAEARDAGLIEPVLVGPERKINVAAEEAGIDLNGWATVPTEHSHEAAERAGLLVAEGQVQALMKGALHTDELLHAVLANPKVRSARRLSHVFIFDDPDYHKLFMVTDGAINIAPTLAQKADIARNAIDLFVSLELGGDPPKLAALAAVETVSPDMVATVDAAALAKMAERGQLGRCLVDGPLAFDNAISAAAAQEKGILSAVAGDPDILLVPNLEAGNMLAKQLTFLGDAQSAGIVVGARLPIALTSRADGARSRLMSCALAVLASRAGVAM